MAARLVLGLIGMSIVPGRDVPAVPEAWVDAVNKAINDAMHEDLCNCDGWPEACRSYNPGTWDTGVSLDIAVGVLEPLIRDRIAAESKKPNKATVTRQLKAAGHVQSGGRMMHETSGFKVSLNRGITPDGVAVLHMGEFGDPAAMESALESYARTLTGLGYDARVEVLTGTLRGVHVRRGAKEANR